MPPYNPRKPKSCSRKLASKSTEISPVGPCRYSAPYNPNAKLMAEMLQSDWSKIGLKVKILRLRMGRVHQAFQRWRNQAMLIGWSGDDGDPDNWLNVLFGCDSLEGNNFSKWCYKPFDDIVKQSQAHLGSGQAHRAVQTGSTHPERPDSNDTYRSLDGVPTHARRSAGFQDQPVWLELLLRCQRQQIRSGNGDVFDVAIAVYPRKQESAYIQIVC